MTDEGGRVDLTSEEKNWAVFAHLATFAGFIVPLGNIIGPLVIWLMKRDQSAFVDHHGKEALNFNISFTIYAIVAAVSIIVLVGLALLPIVLITWLVLVIVAAVRASSGEYYVYPFTMRLVT